MFGPYAPPARDDGRGGGEKVDRGSTLLLRSADPSAESAYQASHPPAATWINAPNLLSGGRIRPLASRFTLTTTTFLGAGQQLRAHIAQFVSTRDGRISKIETYDCYEPFSDGGSQG
jgi:hypothetical protein